MEKISHARSAFAQQWRAGGSDFNINLLDATVADFSKQNKVNSKRDTVVVTEPYLGKPRQEKMTENQALAEVENLKSLYIDFLKNIYQQKEAINLKRVCLVFPIYELGDNTQRSLFEEIVDEIKKIGYTTNCSLKYGREYQVVKREIVLLKN